MWYYGEFLTLPSIHLAEGSGLGPVLFCTSPILYDIVPIDSHYSYNGYSRVVQR